MFAQLRPIWPIAAFAVSASLLAGAHAFERLGGLAPCPLCLDQRELHWAILATAAVCFAALRARAGLARLAAGLLGLGFLASAGLGAYHVAVEQHWVIAQCDAALDLSQIRPMTEEGSFTPPRCDEVQWAFLGVSMAGWNALISLAMGLASFVIALAPASTARA